MIRRAGQAVVRHSSRLLHYLIVLLIGMMVTISIGLGALALRLSHGPIDLTWIATLYGNNIQVTRGGVHLSFQQAALSWEGFHSGSGAPIDIRLSDVRIADSEGRVLASAGRAFAAVSLAPLVLGRVVPQAIELDDGMIVLVRDREGSPDLGLSPALDADVPDATPKPPAPRRSFHDIIYGSDLLGQLDHLRLRDFRLVLNDGAEPADWHAEIKDLALQRQQSGEISGAARVPFVLGDHTADLDLSVRLPREGTGDIRARMSAIEAAAVAKIFPALSFLAAVQAPASTDVTLRLNHELKLIGGYGTVLLDPGQIRLGKSSLSISRGSLRVRGTATQVVIEEAALSVWTGKPSATTTVSLKGRIDRMGERMAASVTAVVENLDISDLSGFWPPEAARNARAWVMQNVRSGSVQRATAALVAESGPDLRDVTLTKATADLDGSNVTLTWLDQIPPIERAQVHLRLADPDKLIITMPTGRQKISNGGTDLLIRDGQMEITGLTAPDQNARINLRVDGPVTSALTLLKEPRLKLLSKHPINLEEPSGVAQLNVGLEFPLDANLQAEQIVFHVAAHLEQVRVARLVAGRNLTDGVLDLTTDANGLTLKGQGALAEIPLTADAFMDFNSGPPTQVLQKVNASARPSVAQLAAAGIPVQDVLASGDVPLTATLIERRSGDGSVAMTADLGNATVWLRALGWKKPVGVPGKASATLMLVRDVLRSIQNIVIESKDVNFAATADAPDGSIRSVTIGRGRIGRTDLQGSVHLPARGPMNVTLAGPALDLSARLEESGDRGGRHSSDLPDLMVKARFDRLFLAHGELATNVSLQAATLHSDVRSLDLTGTLGSRAPFSAHIGPSGGLRRLTADAADAGALLRSLDLTSSMRSGRLQIRGEYDDRLASPSLTGTAQIDDARLENVPLLGKLLQAATLYGVADLLNGPGMGVSRIIVPFRYERGQLAINDARMFSSSLGLTAKGLVDIGGGRIAMSGTVVPAYMLNSALGRIPFVGRIFSPEQGGGLFAARYTLDGPIDDASISVNPLSVLTPGFLRGLFDVGSAGR